MTPLEKRNARKQGGIDNWTFDQHCEGEQHEEVNPIARFPFFLPFNFLPNQQSNKEDYKCQRHVRAYERCQARTQQIQSKGTQRNETSNRSISVAGRAK